MSALVRQISFDLLEPRQIPARGRFTLNQRMRSGRFSQVSYDVADYEIVLKSFDRSKETYISQCEFRGNNRRAANLLSTCLVWVDLDIHKCTDITPPGATPDQLLYAALDHIKQNNIARPTSVTFSGRGLYLKWAFRKPQPAVVGVRASALMKRLVEVFKPLGADPQCVDVSRILRALHSINTKSGETVRVLECRTDPEQLYDFETLFSEMMLFTREEIAEIKKERWRNKAHKALAERQHRIANTLFDFRDLNWKRYHDLMEIALQRWPNGIPVGQRMDWCWVLITMIGWAVGTGQLWHEARAVCQNVAPTLPTREQDEKISQIYRLAKERRSYRFTNDWLIERFGITSDEMLNCKAIIDSNEKNRRLRETRRVHRADRPNGTGLDRQAYEARSATRNEPWRAHGMSRRTYYRHRAADPAFDVAERARLEPLSSLDGGATDG